MGIQGQCDERVGGQDSELYDSQQGKAFSRIEWMASGETFFRHRWGWEKGNEGVGNTGLFGIFQLRVRNPLPVRPRHWGLKWGMKSAGMY